MVTKLDGSADSAWKHLLSLFPLMPFQPAKHNASLSSSQKPYQMQPFPSIAVWCLTFTCALITHCAYLYHSISVLVIYCCIASVSKMQQLQITHIHCITVSVAQACRHGLAEASVIFKAQLEKSCFLAHVIVGRIQFLKSCWPEASLSSLSCRLLYQASMAAGFIRVSK